MRRVTHLLKYPFLSCYLFSFLWLTLYTSNVGAEESNDPANLPVASVSIAEVTEQEIPPLVEVVGTLQANQRAAISAKVTGVISKIPVILGSRVNKGDLLVEISADEILAKVNQAEAQLEQARRNLEREEKLFKKKASTIETVRSMREMHALAQAGYNEAKTMLGYATITAPFSGVVTRKNGNVGDLATPGSPLLLLENNDQLQVVTAVPETLVLHIKTGDSLNVTVPAANLQAQGLVAEIAPSADPNSRTAPIKINLQPNINLRTGQFARVSLPGKVNKTIMVRQKAVIQWGQLEKVFIAESGVAKLRLVRTGSERDGLVEILSGLNPGEKVIIDNHRHLVNGQPIQMNK